MPPAKRSRGRGSWRLPEVDVARVDAAAADGPAAVGRLLGELDAEGFPFAATAIADAGRSVPDLYRGWFGIPTKDGRD